MMQWLLYPLQAAGCDGVYSTVITAMNDDNSVDWPGIASGQIEQTLTRMCPSLCITYNLQAQSINI